ncbi:MAG: hypothetical protein ABEJ36_05915 [Candidatus Nanosalina sp.]
MSFEIEIKNLQEHSEETEVIQPNFAVVEPDIEEIENAAEEYARENLVVIGNGGSVTSFRAFLYAFMPEVSGDVRIVTTMEPDYLHRLSKELDPENTVVMPISKSGSTVGVLESLMFFMERDYPVFAVTSDNDGALRSIVEKENLPWIEHGEVGGRFSGATETALTPAAFAGLDPGEIRKGAEDMYDELDKKENIAYHVASSLYSAEEQGYREVLNPVYSTRLLGFQPLFIQLMHETVCKEGEGMTVYGDLGPEYQHHTNQRLFGGKKDVVPFFFTAETHEKREINIPEELREIDIRGRKLADLDGRELSESLDAEYQGVKDALSEENMPRITMNLTELDYRAAGELLAFLQYLAVYSAKLRVVDPYSQPDVEKSKKIGFEERFI